MFKQTDATQIYEQGNEHAVVTVDLQRPLAGFCEYRILLRRQADYGKREYSDGNIIESPDQKTKIGVGNLRKRISPGQQRTVVIQMFYTKKNDSDSCKQHHDRRNAAAFFLRNGAYLLRVQPVAEVKKRVKHKNAGEAEGVTDCCIIPCKTGGQDAD